MTITASDLQRILVSGVGALLLSAAFVSASIAPAFLPTHQIAARTQS